MDNRSKLVIFILIVITILVGLYLYARYVGTTGLLVNEIVITNDKIPDSFNGLKLVHFSDLHFGRTIFEEELVDIVKKINKIEPDMVVFTGDLIDKDIPTTNAMITTLTNNLKMIDNNIGKYAIVGNHDHENEFYNKIMTDSGFIILNNNYDIVYNKSLEPIFLGGVGNYSYDEADISQVMEYFDTSENLYTIILMHEPDYIDAAQKYPIDLVLAGHSHNGQFRLPFIGKIYTPYGSENYWEPYYKLNNTDLYISSGLGCSIFNVRLFNRPSINFYRLSNK